MDDPTKLPVEMWAEKFNGRTRIMIKVGDDVAVEAFSWMVASCVRSEEQREAVRQIADDAVRAAGADLPRLERKKGEGE